MLRRLCAVVLLAGSISVVLAPSGDADPPAATFGLPGLTGGVPALTDMVIDHAHGQILVAELGGLDVTAADGTAATHVPSSPARIGALALSRDAATLWYSAIVGGALESTDAAHVATATPVVHTLPQSQCPSKIAVDGSDRVWFLYRPCDAVDAAIGLGVYDPANDVFDLTPAVDSQITDLGNVDVLENNPAAADTLVVASPDHTTTIDVATSTTHSDPDPAGADAVAVTSDGQRIARADQGMVTSSPSADPGSTTDTVSFDASSIGVQVGATDVAVSGDDAHLAAPYGGDIVSFGTASGDRTWIRRCETAESIDALAWDGVNVWYVPESATTALGRCDGMTTPQSYIATPPPLSQRTGTTFSVSISLFYRGTPVSGEAISVHRTGQAGAADLADLVTDAQGTATLHDTVGHGGNNYLLSFSGDGTHPAYSTSFGVVGTRDPSTFADSGRHYVKRIDHAITIRNQLVSAATRAGLGGRAVRVVRSDPTGRHVLHTITTSSSGRFTFTDTPRYGPTTHYYVSFAGDTGYLSASAVTYTVTVTRLKPTLAITLKHPAIWYDQDATVRIHLGRTYRNRSVSLIAAPAQRPDHRVLTGKVNRDGDLVADVPMGRNTTFFAEFKGDARYASRQVSVTELSAPRPYVRIVGGYASSGKYRLYHSGTEVKQIGKLLPAHAGQCLRFNAAHRAHGKWVEDAASACIATNRKGMAVAYFHAPRPHLGVAYIFQTFFDGDAVHDGSGSAGKFAKFTAARSSSRATSTRASWKGAWTIRP